MKQRSITLYTHLSVPSLSHQEERFMHPHFKTSPLHIAQAWRS
ncbi:hypothetical protein AM1_5301 [Acaryochloris marina MBIC11017]|uniref:Uncharacterized protein n=1 Tax=Acaryochloris marina (strain MBIC 11017) TaxID=329726 RepID=B0CAQ8_ACAM1|nr:hypothetical protein AM1_5301 [Acaryochloris marina MBIC11017]